MDRNRVNDLPGDQEIPGRDDGGLSHQEVMGVADEEMACQAEAHKGYRLSIIVPAYNEEAGIASIVRRVLATMPDLAAVAVEETEVIVVDDGSCDRTAEIVSAGISSTFGENVRLVCHGRNMGYGAALKTGFSHARGELLAFLDADGTYPPEYLPQLCQAALAGADLVIGSRMAGEESQMPLVRQVGNVVFAALVTLVGGKRVRDSASGMRVMHREVLSRLYPLPDGLNFTPVMSTRAVHENLRVVEVPIPYREREGRSKLSIVHDGTRFLHSIIWTALSYNPVRILGGLGLLMLMLALGLSIWFVGLRISGVTTLNVWRVAALYGVLVLSVCGVSLYTLGSTFNYLIALFYERPIRQGVFGRPILSPWLERQFGWIGLLVTITGSVVGVISLVLSSGGWEISRLWIYLVSSALFTLMGVQLMVSWVLMQVLKEISRRGVQVDRDMWGQR